MKHLRLGKSGLEVSRLCLGCMSFGVPERGNHAWTLNEDDSRPMIRHALDLGFTFLDTANSYSDGTGEEILGRAIRDFVHRDDIVLASKVFYRMRPGPNGGGLSRKAIMAELDASLKRLGTDYLDLYQIHRFDPDVTVEETMEALNDCVKSGKVRYIGASSMYAWQFAKLQSAAERNGWTKFISMQNHLNLLYREEEREMLPLCADLGVGVIPWSPLARGKLTRDWSQSSLRSETDQYQATLYKATEDADRAVVDRVSELARRMGLPMAQVALAWLLHKPGVTAPIIGATKPAHLDDAVAALNVALSAEDIAFLEKPYIPHRPAGHI